jgi:magnesium chelatase subunit D
MVMVTDGRATAGPDALARSRQAAQLLAAERVSSLVLDCETGRFRMGLAGVLADSLGAQYVPLTEVGAQSVLGAVATTRATTRKGRAA